MKLKARAVTSSLILGISLILGGCAGDYIEYDTEPEIIETPTISELVIFTDSIVNETVEVTEETTVVTPKTVIETAPPTSPDELVKGEYVEYQRETVEPETEETTVYSKKGKKNKSETTDEEIWADYDDESYVEYHFRSSRQLEQHFDKHGYEFEDDFDYQDAEDYEKGASDVINNPNALFKYEAEDGDGVYYIESTNEFVILSTDGYIRTYFRPSAGIDYFNRQ